MMQRVFGGAWMGEGGGDANEISVWSKKSTKKIMIFWGGFFLISRKKNLAQSKMIFHRTL